MKHLGGAILAVAVLLPASVQAQHQPYAGDAGREIKALSPEEVKDLLSGAGMGYAKAAELNHFPGPAHVIELADKLGVDLLEAAGQKLELNAQKYPVELVRGSAKKYDEY